ncbi:hypothetical protein AHAS_Ahas02G0190700 [Arachis hypogaea]
MDFTGTVSLAPREEEWMMEEEERQQQNATVDRRSFSQAVKGGKTPILMVEERRSDAVVNETQGDKKKRSVENETRNWINDKQHDMNLKLQ